jgi:hypothetical protein
VLGDHLGAALGALAVVLMAELLDQLARIDPDWAGMHA